MPRLLAPIRVDSFHRTSSPSLRGSKTSLEKRLDHLHLHVTGGGGGSGSTVSSSSSPRHHALVRKNHGKAARGGSSQFSLARSIQRQKSGLSTSTGGSSLRRQKSSRQNSLLSYMRQVEEPTRHNAEWNVAQPPTPRSSPAQRTPNPFWDIVHQQPQGPASSQLLLRPPSVVSASQTSASTDHSSSEAPVPSPPTSLHGAIDDDDARHDLLRRFEASLDLDRRTPGGGGPSLGHPSILHPIDGLGRARSFVPPSQIEEEDAWGHFVETLDAKPQQPLARGNDRSSLARRHPASFGHLGQTPGW